MANRKGAWSQAEYDIVRQNYASLGPVGTAALLPHRSKIAVKKIAFLFRLTCPKGRRRTAGAAGLAGAGKPREQTPKPPLVQSVPAAMRRLAEFDPVVRRAMYDRQRGLNFPSITEAGEAIKRGRGFA